MLVTNFEPTENDLRYINAVTSVLISNISPDRKQADSEQSD